jgi:hypothetical protein
MFAAYSMLDFSFALYIGASTKVLAIATEDFMILSLFL